MRPWQELRHELRLLLRESAALWVSGFVLVVFAVAFWSGISDQRALERRATEARAVVARQTEELIRTLAQIESGSKERVVPDPTLPGTAASKTNPYVLKSSSPLDITAVGEADVRPRLVRLGNPADPTWVQDEVLSPLALASGRFDLAFAIVAILPLAVIALMFRLYSGEQESGVLSLLESGEKPLWALLAQRALLRFVLLACLVSGAFCVGLLAAGARAPLALAFQWVGSVVAYLAFWFLVCFLVSGLRRPSGANIVLLISLWLGLVVLFPAVLNLAVANLNHGPSPLAIRMRYRALLEHSEPTPERVRAFYEQYQIAGFPDDHAPAKSLALREFAQRQVNPDVSALRDAAKRREHFVRLASILNPAVALNTALVTLAGKDGAAFRQFEDYLQQESARRATYFLPLRLHRQKLTTKDYASLPSLSAQEPPAGVSVEESGPLLGWCAVLLMACAVRINKRI
jgi:ABC-2 type transport system permease protein